MDLFDQDEHAAAGLPSRIVGAGCQHLVVRKCAEGYQCNKCGQFLTAQEAGILPPKRGRPKWLPKKKRGGNRWRLT